MVIPPPPPPSPPDNNLFADHILAYITKFTPTCIFFFIVLSIFVRSHILAFALLITVFLFRKRISNILASIISA